MNWLKKMIPLQLKSPVSVFFRELGKYPLDLVYKHALRTYVEEGGRVAGLQKEKIYRDVHKATLAYLDAQYGAMMECHTTDYVSGEKSREPVIWIFWWQGEECAPDIVKRCISSVRQNASGVKVCVIDSGNFGEYVSVPQHIMQKLEQGKISFTHFSDYYRMALLASHGGMWIDASLYAKGQLPREIFDLPVWSVRNPSGIFTNVSNWEWTVGAIAGWKGNTLFCTVEKLLNAYWKANDRVVDYFLLDYMMRLVVGGCAGLQKELAEIPANNPDFMYLQEHLTDPAEIYMDEFYGQDTVLYKISWKNSYPQVTADGKQTVYAKWLAGHAL